MRLRPLLITAALAVGLSVLVSGCSDDDIVTADQKVPKDTMGDVYKADQGTDGYDGGVPDKPKPDMGEDVGLSCKVHGSKIGEKFGAICETKKSTCNGSAVKYVVKSHNLVNKAGSPLTFVCSSMGACVSNETLNNPQNYSVNFVAKGGTTTCGSYTAKGSVK